MASKFLPAPSRISYKQRHFLIMDRPTEMNIERFVAECKSHDVTDVVRVCESSYSTDALHQAGITVTDLPYPDGDPPPPEVISGWFQLLKARWSTQPDACVAIHCVAGLGRAPVMVALALMELGCSYEEAVGLIREKRRGAINKRQLDFLSRYRAKGRLRSRSGLRCVLL